MRKTTLPKRRFYSIRDTMALFGRGVAWVFREIAEGRLKAVKDGRTTLVLADSVEERIAAFTPICTPTMAKAALEAGSPILGANPISTPQGHPRRRGAAKSKAATPAKPSAARPKLAPDVRAAIEADAAEALTLKPEAPARPAKVVTVGKVKDRRPRPPDDPPPAAPARKTHGAPPTATAAE